LKHEIGSLDAGSIPARSTIKHTRGIGVGQQP